MSLKNYQILAFEAISPKGLITLREDGKYLLEGSDACGSTLEMELKWYTRGQTGPIHSVKRIRDGKIFTKGEWVSGNNFKVYGIIDRFTIDAYEDIFVSFFGDGNGCKCLVENIDHATQYNPSYPGTESVERPPLGLLLREISEDIYCKGRINDILEAMTRYNNADTKIPMEWIIELNDLINDL